MKMRLFAVRDGKVEQFFPPMCFQTPGAAQRWFTDVVNNDKSDLYKHPGDYALYSIGQIETDTGMLTATTVELVVTGMDVCDVVDGADKLGNPLPLVKHA